MTFPSACHVTFRQRDHVRRPIKWGYFRARRYAGDQEDLGKEIQLDDYLIT